MEATAEEVQVAKYPAYKDSGVEWLGEIPEHWETLANKYIFTLKKNLVGKKSGDFVLLSLTLNGVIKRDMENPQGKFPAEFKTYQEVNKGDFIFCLFDVEETPRTVGLSKYDGMITGAYTVMQPNDDFDKGFLYYFYLNLDADKRLKPLYTGLRNAISKENFFSFRTFVPPKEEQTAIAQFLDRKTAQIDKAIGIKEKQIELLKERRQVLIHNAVTRGLNPDAPMKDSGVEWIGEIPAHWEVKSLKHFCFITKLTGFEYSNHWRITEDGDVIALRGFNIAEGRLSLNETECISKELSHFLNRSKLHKGDIVYPCTGTIGNAALIEEDDRYHINQNIAKISPDMDLVDPYFLLSVLLSHPIKAQIHFNNTSQMQPVILIGGLRNINVPFPPKEEQLEIENYIQRFSEKANRSIFLKEKEIEKLKEYKASLINSAVTGKIKVS